MTKENKTIKELKRVNHKLKHQYELLEIREHALRHKYEDLINEIERLNNIINEIEKDIKNLYTYGIKNNREQKDYLLNRLDGLKTLKGVDKE